MRTRIFTFIFILMVINCYSSHVSIELARITARNFYLERINQHSQRSQVTITGEFTITQANMPVYYIFNIDNEGFIIISADDQAYPVLGYSFEGTYKGNNKCPAFNYWMDNYKDQIIYIKENQLSADEKISQAWQEYSNECYAGNNRQILDLEPLITSKWHQDFPFNTNCPYEPQFGDTNLVILDNLIVNLHNHVWSGCVATSAGMIMDYWRYPLLGNGNHCDTVTSYGDLCVDYLSANYEWAGISEV